MFSRWVRTWDSRVVRPVLILFQHIHITPNELTHGSLALTVVAGLLIGLGFTGWGIVALLAGGLFDVLDGELARLTSAQTPFGAFLDSICDHYGDLALYLGFLWRFFNTDNHTGIVLVMLAMFGSVFGSHVRSRAGMVGIDLKRVGFFTRLERLLVMILGVVFHQLVPAFWVLAVMNNSTALQRILYTLQTSRRDAKVVPAKNLTEQVSDKADG